MIVAYKFVLEATKIPTHDKLHIASTINHPEDTLRILPDVVKQEDGSPGFAIEYMNLYTKMDPAPYRKNYVHLDAALVYEPNVLDRIHKLLEQGDIRVSIFYNNLLVGKTTLNHDDPYLFCAKLDWHSNLESYELFNALHTEGGISKTILIKLFLDSPVMHKD